MANNQSEMEENGDQERLQSLQEECERLRREVVHLEQERDNLKASLSEVEKERDEFRKTTYNLLRQLYPVDPVELERWARETLESFERGDRFYSGEELLQELERCQGA